MKSKDPVSPTAPDDVSGQVAEHGVTRRDFIQGIAVAIGTGAVAGLGAPIAAADSAPQILGEPDPDYYPPALTGMRGSHDGSFEVPHQLRDSGQWLGEAGIDSGERYDLVVVGAGVSGLAAAYAYRKTHPSTRVLILDNHDDFGGHAKRNEFQVGDKSLIGYGGSQTIEAHAPSEVVALLSEIGIELRRFLTHFDTGFRKSHDLMNGVFFDKETFGSDHLARGHVELPFDVAFDGAPLSSRAKADLKRLFTQKIDYLEGRSLEEKYGILSTISFNQFLLEYAKVDPELIAYYFASPCEVTGVGTDASSAIITIAEGTWFPTYPQHLQSMWNLAEGMKLGLTPIDVYGYVCHFPDGNAGVARAFVRALVPDALPGSTMEDLVSSDATGHWPALSSMEHFVFHESRLNYAILDRPEAPVRIRLNSTVVRAQHVGSLESSEEAEVTYVRRDQVHRVKTGSVVMACYNTMIPRLCPELPEKQREALAYPVKVPLVYTNVAIRNWRSLKKLGVAEIYCPGSFFYSVTMDFPVSMGDYRYTTSPDEPVILHLVTHIPAAKGAPARAQRRAARGFLYATPFEIFEAKIRDQLDRILGPGGFDSNRDIAGITVNRWPHGYADSLDGLDDPGWSEGEAPNVVGRQRFGRITIANSDAGAAGSMGVAIEQGLRAVRELS